MTDDELRSHFQHSGDAAPDFSKILERQKRRYRPRPLAVGLLIFLIAIAPIGWVWTNTREKQIASLNHRIEATAENRLLVRATDTKKSSLAGAATALVPEPVATGLLKSQAAAQGPACKLVPVVSTRTVPPYPAISIQLRESGVVDLEVTVARNGHVSGARVTHSSGFPRLDEAAASFVRQNYLWQPIACGSAKTQLRVVWELGSGGAR